MTLTAAAMRDYHCLATEKDVAGFDSPRIGGDEPQSVSSAAFLRPGVPVHGRPGRGAARLAGAVPGLSTRSVLPTPFDSGASSSANELNGVNTMSDTLSFKSIRQFRRWVFKNLERKTTRYHYPTSHLEQPYFTHPGTGKVTLRLAMLADTTQFVSPLFALLNQIRSEGNDISGAFDEAVAMRTALQQADQVMEQLGSLAIKGRFMAAGASKSSGE